MKYYNFVQPLYYNFVQPFIIDNNHDWHTITAYRIRSTHGQKKTKNVKF
jgi:hypothetical protein